MDSEKEVLLSSSDPSSPVLAAGQPLVSPLSTTSVSRPELLPCHSTPIIETLPNREIPSRLPPSLIQGRDSIYRVILVVLELGWVD